MLVVEHATELLAGAQNLAASMNVPTWVHRRQVEELERTLECSLEPIRAALFVRTKRTLDFTPDVSQLLGQRERVPTPGGEGGD
jgi:hypothetical protein